MLCCSCWLLLGSICFPLQWFPSIQMDVGLVHSRLYQSSVYFCQFSCFHHYFCLYCMTTQNHEVIYLMLKAISISIVVLSIIIFSCFSSLIFQVEILLLIQLDNINLSPLNSEELCCWVSIYDKLLHPRKLPCLLYLLTSIICVALSCFILLADFFTMVKIDDRYPDEWND